jgi:hypothetical protein
MSKVIEYAMTKIGELPIRIVGWTYDKPGHLVSVKADNGLSYPVDDKKTKHKNGIWSISAKEYSTMID